MTREEAVAWLSQPGIQAAFHDPHTKDAIHTAIKALSAEPPTIRGKHQLSAETPTDLISRADAIDAVAGAIWHYPNQCYKDLNVYEFAEALAKDALSAIPSADAERPKVVGVDYSPYRIQTTAPSAEATCATCADRTMCIMSEPDGHWKTCKDYRAESNSDAYKRGFEDCKRAYEVELARSAEAVQGWIPCSERLPKINQRVLVATTDERIFVGHREKPDLVWQVTETDGRKHWVYDPENYTDDIESLPKNEDCGFAKDDVYSDGFLSVTSINYDDRFEGVTAWMPLPTPYKESEVEE